MTQAPYSDSQRPSEPDARDRLVYVLPETALPGHAGADLTLLDAWNILWDCKWLIAGITSAFAVVSIAYALTATKWYKASVLLVPTQESSAPALTGALGSLASLAGVTVGVRSDSREALAVLRSRDFTRAFIEDNDLLPVLFPGRPEKSAGNASASGASRRPDIQDAVRYFGQSVRSVTRDQETGLITLAIEWKDPALAASWANMLVRRVNDRMRQRALQEARTNVAFLKKEFAETSVVTLQQSIGQLLETELQKLMLARGREEFAFRVIDGARPPNVRDRPARKLIVVLCTFIGGITGICIAFVRNALRSAGASARAGR